MPKCYYIYKGHKFNSELELDDFLLRKGDKMYSKYGDIVFHKAQVVEALEKVENIKQEVANYQKAYQEAKNSYLDGEDTLEFKPPYIGVTEFLRGLTTTDNKLLTPEFREIEYWKERLLSWKDSTKGFNEDEKDLFGDSVTITDNVSNQELEKFLKDYKDTDGKVVPTNTTLQLIKQVKQKWEAQAHIGTAIHEVLRLCFEPIKSSKSSNAGKMFLESQGISNSFRFKDPKITDYLTSQQIDETVEYAKKLKAQLEQRLEGPLTFLPEFKISTKLNYEVKDKGDVVLGSIDLLVIDGNGQTHVIDYKVSPKNTFNSAKERTFWYQLGLYNRMLQSHNLTSNTNTDKVMVAPILIKGFRKEEDKFTFDTVIEREDNLLQDITMHIVDYTVSNNLDQFISEKPVINLTPEETIQKVNTFSSIALPKISTSKSWDDEEINQLIKINGGYKKNELTKKIEVTLGNNVIYQGTSETEVFNKIKKYYREELPKRNKSIIQSIYASIETGIREETNEIELPKVVSLNSEEGASITWLKDKLGKYCNKQYKLIENDTFKSYGLVVLENVVTHQIDILKITSDNLDFRHKINGSDNRTLITGAICTDQVEARKTESLALPATNGNIHLMETMAILNCIPDLTSSKAIIGEISVVNPSLLQGTSGSNKELIYNFNQLSNYVNSQDSSYINNIEQLKFADKYQLVTNQFRYIMNLGESEEYKKQFTKLGKDGYKTLATDLDSIKSVEQKLQKLENLKILLEKDFSKEITISTNSYNEQTNPAKSLYDKVMLAIAELNGINFRQQTKDNQNYLESMNIAHNGVQSLMLDNPGNLNSETLNLLTKLATQAYQNVREDMAREAPKIRQLSQNFKRNKNFSKITEMTFGNQASLYKSMLEYKDNDIYFKNPWSLSFSESPEAKEFLKYILTVINKNRFNLNDEDIQDMIKSNNPKFFRVPLCKGDLASQAAQLGGLSKALKNKLERLKPEVWWDDMQRKITGVFSDTLSSSRADDSLFKMNNMFEKGELNEEARAKAIEDHGIDYFETNLETLVLKHIFAYSMQEHINNIMPMAKAAMIHLNVQGQLSNKQFKNSTNYVSDYIKNKIKGESIIDPKLKKANAILGQIRGAASFMMLGFSPIQYGYQLLQGLWTDIRLMYQHSGNAENPFTFENFSFAFKEVYKDLFTFGGTITKCSLVNEFFGINDMDTNVLADKIKSDKYGIFNISNIAFHCASRPDFYNRMALFVAQMKKDGVWEAYTKTSGNKLKYDWKLDKRFDVFASGDKSNPKYEEQQGLYYAIAEQLIREKARNANGTEFKLSGDPNNPTPLPKAYTNQQVESFKSLSDDIYGYYSHEKKAMIHATTLGALWIQMRTFWSGKKNQYLGAPGITLKGHYVQQKNKDGDLLYLVEEEGKLIPKTAKQIGDKSKIPFYKWEGQWQEGILVTLAQLYSQSKTDGFRTVWEDLWEGEDEIAKLHRANIRQLIYDLTIFFVVGTSVSALMADWDDDLIKDAKKSQDLGEALRASAAHMAMKMVSNSFLDFNFFNSIGSPILSWQPISFAYLGSRISDLGQAVLGDKDFKDVLLRMTSFTSQSKIFWDVALS